MNAAGANLNREWCDSTILRVPSSSSEDDDENEDNTATTTNTSPTPISYPAPSLERSPEVYYVLEKMKQTGCDIFCDIHGDEEIPYNFLAEACVPNFGTGSRLQSLHGAFLAAYCRANSDMQQTYAYEPSAYDTRTNPPMNIANDHISDRFQCLAMTLEMPFKDCWSNSDPLRGWSPSRSQALGASLIEPLVYIEPYLRRDDDNSDNDNEDIATTFFAKHFTDQDRYILPTSQYQPKT